MVTFSCTRKENYYSRLFSFCLVSICTVHCLLRRPNPDCEIQTFISPYGKFVFGVSFRLNIWFDVKHLHLWLHESSSPVRSIRSHSQSYAILLNAIFWLLLITLSTKHVRMLKLFKSIIMACLFTTAFWSFYWFSVISLGLLFYF